MTIAHVLAIALAATLLVAAGMTLAIRRIQRRETHYQRLLDQMPNNTVIGFDQDLRIQFALGEAVRDRDQGSTVGRLIEEVIREGEPELSPETIELIGHFRAALAGEERIFEYRYEVTGSLFRVRTAPVSEGGEIVSGLAMIENISAQRRTELELTVKADQRRLILDEMNEAYVSTDERGLVTAWNPAAQRTFGWSAEEATGQWLPGMIIPEEDHPDFEQLMARAVPGMPTAGRAEMRVERTALNREGKRFPIELALILIDVEGRTELHTLMHDITDRKSSEFELREHAADVEAIADVIGELSRSTVASEARAAICRAAIGIAEADVGALFEPDPTGTGLRATASEGMEIIGDFVHFSQRSAVGRSFSTREPFFAADVVENPAVSPMIIKGRQISSALWVPVTHDDEAIGVIVVAWKNKVRATPPRLTRVMGVIAAEAAVAIERAALLDRLERMAHTDDLTGLINRRAWDLDVVREVARARRDGTPLAVAMLDLDRFKDYNDRHGHQAGDRVLHEAASAWRTVLRETDLLARYGGEEFAVALPGCTRDAAEVLVERLREVTPGGQSCSAGLACWDGAESAEELLGRADRAMYEAKQTGRDRIVIA